MVADVDMVIREALAEIRARLRIEMVPNVTFERWTAFRRGSSALVERKGTLVRRSCGVASGRMVVMVDVGWRRHRGRLGSCSGFLVLGKVKTTGLGRSRQRGAMT